MVANRFNGITAEQLIASIKEDLQEVDEVYRNFNASLKGAWLTPTQREFAYLVQRLNLQRCVVDIDLSKFPNENFNQLIAYSDSLKHALNLIPRLEVVNCNYSMVPPPPPQFFMNNAFQQPPSSILSDLDLDNARKMFSMVNALLELPANITLMIHAVQQAAECMDTPPQIKLRLYHAMLSQIDSDCTYSTPKRYLTTYTRKQLTPEDPASDAEPKTIEWLESLYKQLEQVLMGSSEVDAEKRLDIFAETYNSAVTGTPNAEHYFQALSKVCLRMVAPPLSTQLDYAQ